MISRIARVLLVALVVVLAGLNWYQWRLRTRQGPVQDLPAAEVPVAAAPLSPPSVSTGAARNLVLFIGDGMGIEHVAAASLRSGDDRARLEMERMPVTGLVRTHSASHFVTDSAAGATALSTGVRTRNQALGIDTNGRPREHLLAAAARSGRATGVVTSDEITGATPAGFLVHAADRDDRVEIAEKLTEAPADLLIGGGREFLSGRGLLSVAREKGFEIATSAEELEAAKPGRLLAVLTPGPLGDRPDVASLERLTELAIRRLSGDPEGFVLVVEDTHIDWRSHEWKGVDVTDRVLALDRAVGVARRFAARTPRTLVLVTADHETGGMAMTTRERTPRRAVAAWVTQGHSAAPVAIYAEGAGATAFTGVMHLTDVADRIRATLGLR
jgi:alkaline phosphatase